MTIYALVFAVNGTVNDAKESLKVAEEPTIQGKGVASLSEIIVSSQIRRDTRWAPH